MSETFSKSAAYVRRNMIAPQTPPASQAGAVKWVRDNLASSWLNVLMTLASVFVLYWLVTHILPWLSNSVWNARSLAECRDVLVAMGAANTGGACWAVLQERLLQLLYGFYPSHLYWRPNLTLILFFVAIAPILFANHVPRKLIWFSLLYPFLAPFLLWGGAFWTPLLVLAGFGLAFAVHRVAARLANGLAATILAILVTLAWWFAAVPAIGNALQVAVTESRFERLVAQLPEDSANASARIADLEAEVETYAPQIAALESDKQDALAQLLAANAAAEATAEDAVRAEFGLGPAAEAAADEPRNAALQKAVEAAKDVAVARIGTDPAYAAQRETVITSVQALTDLRNITGDLSGQINFWKDTRTEANGLLNNLQSLEERLARRTALADELVTLKAAVPEALQGIETSNQRVPAGTSRDDAALLAAYLEARGEMDNLNIALDSTYDQAGRIGLVPVDSREFGGFMLALVIGTASIVLSLPLGILLALGRQSDLFLINKVCVGFIETIRGIPLIVWLFTAQTLLNYFLPPGTNFDLMLRVIIMVTLFASAYIAEVVRGGLAALPRGQYEAADALGLDYPRAMRLIILPQALKISIPGIVNTFIGLFKDTTLVLFIGLLDPIGLSNAIRASTEWNGIYWELFIFIGILFFLFCFGMSRYSIWLERKLQTDHR